AVRPHLGLRLRDELAVTRRLHRLSAAQDRDRRCGEAAAHGAWRRLCVARAMNLRGRLVLGLAVIAATVGALGATGAYVSTSNRLDKSVDESLLARADDLSHAQQPHPRPTQGGGFTRPDACPAPGELQPATAAQL